MIQFWFLWFFIAIVVVLANMDAIKRMTVDQVAKKVGLETGDDELENIMGIIREQMASRKRSRRSGRITISRKSILDDDIPQGEDRFNVLNHFLVPHHELIPVDQEESRARDERRKYSRYMSYD